MQKISRVLNIIFFLHIFSFNIFGMSCLKDVPDEILQIIFDYSLGDLQLNKEEFKKQYKNILNLRLVNKSLKNIIDNFFSNEKLHDNFENKLFNYINNNSLSLEDRLDKSINLGSKKFFDNLSDLDVSIVVSYLKNHNKLLEFIVKILDSQNNNNTRFIEFIFKKFLLNTSVTESLKNQLFFFNKARLDKLNIIINNKREEAEFKKIFSEIREYQSSGKKAQILVAFIISNFYKLLLFFTIYIGQIKSNINSKEDSRICLKQICILLGVIYELYTIFKLAKFDNYIWDVGLFDTNKKTKYSILIVFLILSNCCIGSFLMDLGIQ